MIVGLTLPAVLAVVTQTFIYVRRRAVASVIGEIAHTLAAAIDVIHRQLVLVTPAIAIIIVAAVFLVIVMVVMIQLVLVSETPDVVVTQIQIARVYQMLALALA